MFLPELQIERINEDAVIPRRANPTDSGLDLCCVSDVFLSPGEKELIHTGWKMSVSPGYEIQIRPRSGLSLKTDLVISNSPGTVDSGFLGEVCVIIKNTGKDPYFIKKYDRIAQMVIAKVELLTPNVVDKLKETDRGEGGFGSTGR